jgi:hypothetical protein
MPTEFRRIVFSNMELREALISHRNEEKVVLPTGALRTVRFVDESRDRLAVGVHDPSTDQVTNVEVATPFVAAALLRYCIARRIPIQRSAQKSLTLAGENVALDLRSVPKTTEAKASEAKTAEPAAAKPES